MNGKNRSASSLSWANRTVDCLHTYQCCVCFGWISNHKRNVFPVLCVPRTELDCRQFIRWMRIVHVKFSLNNRYLPGENTQMNCASGSTHWKLLFFLPVSLENYFTLHINTTTHSKCSGRAFFMGLKCKCNVLWCKWMYLKSAKQALFSTSFWFTFGNLHCCTALFLLSKDTK